MSEMSLAGGKRREKEEDLREYDSDLVEEVIHRGDIQGKSEESEGEEFVKRAKIEKHERPTQSMEFWLGRGAGQGRLSEFFADRTTNDWVDTDSAEESITEESSSTEESREKESIVEESSDEVSGERHSFEYFIREG